eukprot:TRINITY_DN33142_c0_g2_i2.p1 TRINITY_DN33142_c0_g2~~TRINITY_DN33142_c0_g2_i2.p1  ORF type:complete len:281 (-),score=48.33 TRINITY_DN33142_c0_g2_i2:213-1055(-)
MAGTVYNTVLHELADAAGADSDAATSTYADEDGHCKCKSNESASEGGDSGDESDASSGIRWPDDVYVAGRKEKQSVGLREPKTKQEDDVQNVALARFNPEVAGVGWLGYDGHVFATPSLGTKSTHDVEPEGQRKRKLLLLLEDRLRTHGRHTYTYEIQEGSIGKAGGIGFAFDTALARRNLSTLSCFFLNAIGQLCVRQGSVCKALSLPLHRLDAGIQVTMTVDLDERTGHFLAEDMDGQVAATAVFPIDPIIPKPMRDSGEISGYFCAILHGTAVVSLH